MNINKTLIFIVVAFLLISCKKDKLSVVYEQQSLPQACKVKRIIFLNDSLMFACGGIKLSAGYIFKSTDAGKNWEVNYSGKRKFNSIFFVNEQTGFACGDSMLFTRTLDGGKTWIDTLKYNYFWQEERVNLQDLYFWNSKNGLLVGGDDYERGNLYASFDAGNFLHCIHNRNGANRLTFPSPRRGFVSCYGLIIRLFDTIAYNSPSGFSIKHEFADLQGDNYTGLSFLNETTGWACGYNGSIYKTMDGGYTWTETINTSERFNDVIFINQTTGYVVGEDGYIGKTVNGGQSWQELDAGQSTDNVQCVAFRNNKLFCGTENGKIITIKE